jgi:hypothetical protein
MSLDLACMVGEVSWRRSAPSTSAHGRLHGGRSYVVSMASPAYAESAEHHVADTSKLCLCLECRSSELTQ